MRFLNLSRTNMLVRQVDVCRYRSSTLLSWLSERGHVYVCVAYLSKKLHKAELFPYDSDKIGKLKITFKS